MIRHGGRYLQRETRKESEGEEEKGERWMGMSMREEEEDKTRLTLREKIGLMGLLREVVSGGGEIEEREELMRGIEGVISEGRERGDSEGMLAEEGGERLLWVIEKKSRGREMKSRREIEREKEVMKREKEEAERQLREYQIEHPPTVATLTSLSITLTNSSRITLRGNTIIHTGSTDWESCTFNDELKNV